MNQFNSHWHTESLYAVGCCRSAVSLPLLSGINILGSWSRAFSHRWTGKLHCFLHLQLQSHHALLLLQLCNLLLLFLQQFPLLCDNLLLSSMSVFKPCAGWRSRFQTFTPLPRLVELSSTWCYVSSGHLPRLSGLGQNNHCGLHLMQRRGVGG